MWKDQAWGIGGENRSPEHHTPTTQEAPLPFGLDATIDDLDQGPTGIRTPRGAEKHIAHLAYWLWTSNYPSSPPNYNHPIAWMIAMLQTPYPWEQWGTPLHPGDEWETWADDLHKTRTIIGKYTTHNPIRAGKCPWCGSTLLTRPTDNGWSKQVTCTNQDCRVTGNIDHLTIAHQLSLKETDADIWITGKEAVKLWPELTHDTLRDWVRHERIKTRGNNPRQYPLGTINTLARELIRKRQVA